MARVRIQKKCEKCGNSRYISADEYSPNLSPDPIRIEVCSENCSSIIAEPSSITKHRHKSGSVKDNYSNMMDSEKEVAEFLNELNLPWIFEYPIFVYDERKRPRLWTPDFYLPGIGIFIEVCGSQNFNYKYREKICKENNVPIIFLHFFKVKEFWKKFLFKRIQEVEDEKYHNAKKLMASIPEEISKTLT